MEKDHEQVGEENQLKCGYYTNEKRPERKKSDM